ncbi:MAG: 50S ribosomal protein L3 [Candidatus Paceibacterota bacterium]
MKFSFAKKIGMTQVFEGGKVVPVTKVQLYSDVKVQSLIESPKNGYNAFQFGAKYVKKVKDSLLPKLLREVRVAELTNLEVGTVLDISQYEVGDTLIVKGVSKGKGFAGVVKRHNFAGSNATHGTKHTERSGGSIGSGYPEHVLKGRKMPGRDGFKAQTLKNIRVVDIDVENNQLLLKGSIPGPNNGLLQIVG